VLRAAADAGVNYIDILYPDPEGEPDFWKAFWAAIEPLRRHFYLAAHWGPPHDDLDAADRALEQVLARLGGYAEIVIIHAIDAQNRWDGWAQESLLRLSRYREQGRVSYIGLSGHNPSVARTAVRSERIDVLMFTVNMVSHEVDRLRAPYERCVEYDVGLVAMKPYHGGTLLNVNGRPSGITPIQCLGYALSQPVAVAVPGPKNLDEWMEAIHYLDASDDELDYRKEIGGLRDRLQGQCVYCGHCLPCPEGIQLHWVIWHVDDARWGDAERAKKAYSNFAVKASACVECGDCLDRCPFDVDIMAKISEAVSEFEAKR
jgi:predicted aldo/keto reductase-like oxidoreductase